MVVDSQSRGEGEWGLVPNSWAPQTLVQPLAASSLPATNSPDSVLGGRRLPGAWLAWSTGVAPGA